MSTGNPPIQRWAVPLYPELLPHPFGPSPRPEARTEFAAEDGGVVIGQSALAPHLPVSILPPDLYLIGADPILHPWWPTGVPLPDWCGVLCDLVVVRLRFPNATMHRPAPAYFVTALLPRQTEPWMGSRFLIGAEFLTTHNADVRLTYSRTMRTHPASHPGPMGELVI